MRVDLEKTKDVNTIGNNNADNVHELKIGKITYTIVSHFNENSSDTAITKIERLITRDAKAS